MISMPLLYMNGNIDAGMPRVMQRSSALKSETLSNGMSDQLLVIVADRRSPSAVSGGTRPFAGSTINDVSRFGSPISAQWPMPILLVAISWS